MPCRQCLISGLLLVLISALGISRYLLTLIPRSVRLATVIGMGLQIALAGTLAVMIF
jgi:xanthine/uracil/vitamin C permease (AzgA family)